MRVLTRVSVRVRRFAQAPSPYGGQQGPSQMGPPPQMGQMGPPPPRVMGPPPPRLPGSMGPPPPRAPQPGPAAGRQTMHAADDFLCVLACGWAQMFGNSKTRQNPETLPTRMDGDGWKSGRARSHFYFSLLVLERSIMQLDRGQH